MKNLVNAHVPFVHVCTCACSRANFLSNVFSFLLKRAGFNFCPSLPYQEHSKHGFKQIQKASQSANLWKVQKPTLERKVRKLKPFPSLADCVVNEALVYGRYSSTCTPLKWFNSIIFLDGEVICFLALGENLVMLEKFISQ